MMITDARHLTNMALVDAVGRLAGREREVTVAFIIHIAEFDARRLYAESGLSSTFRYCIEVLHLSEDAAWNRIDAGRAARAHPVVLEMLVAGTLSPTTARMLRPHLTEENHREVLAAASGRSKREVEALLAARFPRPDVPAMVRPLGPSVIQPRPPVPEVIPGCPALSTRLVASSWPCPPDAPPTVVEPPAARVSADRYEVRFTAHAETADLLRRAQDLLAGSVAPADLDAVFRRALALLVADIEHKKAALTKRRPLKDVALTPPAPASAPPTADGESRYLPAAVRRAVWIRDDGRCTFVAGSRRCGERRRLEFHHGPVPFAAGGKPTVENIHLLCHSHNRHESGRFYGPGREYGGIDLPRDTVRAQITRSGTGGTAEAGRRADSSRSRSDPMPP